MWYSFLFKELVVFRVTPGGCGHGVLNGTPKTELYHLERNPLETRCKMSTIIPRDINDQTFQVVEHPRQTPE